jgi:hypothetical protein
MNRVGFYLGGIPLMKFRALALVGAMFAAAAPAAVSAQTYSAAEVKKSVNVADLKAIVAQLGHTLNGEGEYGEVSVAATDEYGIIYLLIGTACDVNDIPGCQGIMMQVRYDIPADLTFERLAEANLAQAAINTWADFSDGTLGFTRYQVLDDGVTMANISANVLVLLDVSSAAYGVVLGEAGF